MNVSIVGGGMMGSAIASKSALAGNPTVIVDRTEEMANNAFARMKKCLQELVEYGLIGVEEADAAQNRVSVCADLRQGVSGAEMIIEAITENLAAKQELFEKLDALAPKEVPITSNTSGLRITDIAAKAARHPERTMTTHFWFPGHLVPLVEVVLWEKTDPAMAGSVKQTLQTWGKVPVIVKRDLPGQLANRILQAMIREAVHIVEIGLATPEDVDAAIKAGPGIRLPVWGVLEHIDGVGLDLGRSVQDTVLPELCDDKAAAPLLNELVEKGQLGYKSGRGFYDWNVKDMDKLAENRNRFIVQALKTMESFR